MRVLVTVRHDEETHEEVRTLIAEPEEIHWRTDKACQDIFRRWNSVGSDERHDGHGGRSRGKPVASSCGYGCSCTDTEGSKPDASTVGPPTNHGHVFAVQLFGREGHDSLTSSGGATRGYPSRWREASQTIASQSVYGLCCWQWKVKTKELPRLQSTRPSSST